MAMKHFQVGKARWMQGILWVLCLLMVVPVIEELINGPLPVTVYVQDDPTFPESLTPVHDLLLSKE